MSTFDESKVFILRLMTNEEVIGLIDLEVGASAVVKLPFIIAPVRDQKTGELRVQLAPYLPLSDYDIPITFPPSVQAFSYKPDPSIIEQYKGLYLQMTSNIVLPNSAKGIIIP